MRLTLCFIVISDFLFSISALGILSESVQSDEGQPTQCIVLNKLYTVLSKGLNNRVTNLSIRLQCNKEVCLISQ